MDNDSKGRNDKSFENMFPPELMKLLKGIELAPETILNSDEIYGLLNAYTENFSKIVVDYFEQHPLEMLLHTIERLKKENDSSNILNKLGENRYIAPFFDFLLSNLGKTSEVFLSKFEDIGKIQQWFANWIFQAQEMATISQIKSFEGRARQFMQKSDKVIEVFFKEVLIDIAEILEISGIDKMTLGEIKNAIIRSGNAAGLDFILIEDIYNLRIAAAHKYEIDFAQEKVKLFKRGEIIKIVTVEEIERILKDCLMICSGYYHAVSMLLPIIAMKNLQTISQQKEE